MYSISLGIAITYFYIGPFAKPNGKERGKTSTGSRQATLFNMLPLQHKDITKQKNPFGKKGVDSTPAVPQARQTQNPDSQEVDSMETLVETDQSQPEESGWEETQMVEDVDGTQVSIGYSIS